MIPQLPLRSARSLRLTIIHKPIPRLRAMHIQSIPMCEHPVTWASSPAAISNHSRGAKGVGSSNNYAYLVTDEPSKDAVIVDPANPSEYVLCSGRLMKHDLPDESLSHSGSHPSSKMPSIPAGST